MYTKYAPTTRRIFKNKQGDTIKPATIESYNMHMESVDKGQRRAKSYSMTWCTFKLTKKSIFFTWFTRPF